jgi:hypothetical protein
LSLVANSLDIYLLSLCACAPGIGATKLMLYASVAMFK